VIFPKGPLITLGMINCYLPPLRIALYYIASSSSPSAYHT